MQKIQVYTLVLCVGLGYGAHSHAMWRRIMNVISALSSAVVVPEVIAATLEAGEQEPVVQKNDADEEHWKNMFTLGARIVGPYEYKGPITSCENNAHGNRLEARFCAHCGSFLTEYDKRKSGEAWRETGVAFARLYGEAMNHGEAQLPQCRDYLHYRAASSDFCDECGLRGGARHEQKTGGDEQKSEAAAMVAIDWDTEFGESLMGEAMHKHNWMVMRLLLVKQGSASYQRKGDGVTPLMAAAQHDGDVRTIKLLVEANAPLDTQDSLGWTALMHAIQRGSDVMRVLEEVVGELLRAKASPDVQEVGGATALMLASQRGQNGVVNLLLAANARTDIQDAKGNIALAHAATQNYPAVVATLLQDAHGEPAITMKNNVGRTVLLQTMGQNIDGIEVIQQLLVAAPHLVHEPDSHGATPLTHAAHHNRPDILKMLLDAKAIVDQQMPTGCTALMAAAEQGAVEAIGMLLNAKAQVDLARHEDSCIPLMFAVVHNKQAVVKALLADETQREKQLCARDNKGKTALILAVGAGASLEIIKELAEKGKSSLDYQDSWHLAALTVAVIQNNVEAVKALVDAKASPDVEDSCGRTPLFYAQGCKNQDIIMLLENAEKEKGVRSEPVLLGKKDE